MQETKKNAVSMLLEFIQSNDIEVGSHLPSERQLSEKLGISRGQVRNALKELACDGTVEVVPQVGTILRSRFSGASVFRRVLNMESMDIQSLIEVRVSLEVTAAGLAARRATEEDLRKIEKAFLEYEKEASAYSPWHEQNQRFHMAIICASKNGAIMAIMENLLNEVELFTRSRQSSYTQERLNRSIREHKAILSAIRNHDEPTTIREMTFHMRKMSAMAEELNKIIY